MSFDVAIQVQNLSKSYKTYNRSNDRLKQSVVPRLQRLLGRPPAVYYHEFWALKDVSFEVRKGETVGIIGRNGSGKSTLLQLICGTIKPTSGSVTTTGRIAALLELGAGFNPEFTGRENVFLNGAILGLGQQEIESRFDAIAAFADIGEFIEQPVKTYSSGMYMRLAFAVQSQIEPDIFIVDEALAVGDEKFQRKCFAHMEHMKERGTSILFVSHSASQVSELCDRALFLHRGERLMWGIPFEALRAYHKLLYVPENDQERLIEQFKSLDKLGEIAKPTIDYAAEISSLEKGKPAQGDGAAYFDLGLVSETTQMSPVQGAEIGEIMILDTAGNVVNVLVQGNNYRFLLKGRFIDSCRSVRFGIHIRSVTGTTITGQRYPEEGASIECADAGEKFCVTFSFKITLLPGCYFSGGGIWSDYDPLCLHTIQDGLMFRVLPAKKNISFGFYDASFDAPQLELGVS